MFHSQNTFEMHIQDRHAKAFEKAKLPAIVSLSQRESIKLPSICPVCNLHRKTVETVSFVDHLADCIHGFSLASLPWNDTVEQNVPTLVKEAIDSISLWTTQVENSKVTEELTEADSGHYLLTSRIDLSSKDASDSLLPNEEYFDDNDKVSLPSNISARADTASTTRSERLSIESVKDWNSTYPEIGSEPKAPESMKDWHSTHSVTGREPKAPDSMRDWSPARPSVRRAKSEDSEKAGIVWAREIDDPWWPSILSLDGGGIKGYSTLLILKALMHEVWVWESSLNQEENSDASRPQETTISEHKLLPCHYFDFMYGSSSGGLIATLLGRLRMTVQEALEFWPRFGDAVFGRKRSSMPLSTKYHHQPFEELLKVLVKSKCTDHVNCDGSDYHPWGSDRSWPEVGIFDVDEPRLCQSCCLTATHDSTLDAHLLRTYNLNYDANTPNWITRYNEGADKLMIWQAVRATLAAPFYMEALSVEIDGVQRSFRDAGIRENNPSGAALSEFHALYDQKAESPALLLSIGAGRPESVHDGFGYPSGPVGRLPLVGKFLEKRAVVQNLLIKYTEGETQHMTIRQYAHGEHLWYKRLNVSHGLGNVPMDEWAVGKLNGQAMPGGATLAKIESATMRYLWGDFDPEVDSYASPFIMRRQTAEKLVRQRRAREQQGGLRWETFLGK